MLVEFRANLLERSFSRKHTNLKQVFFPFKVLQSMQYAKTCLKPDDTSFIQLRHPTAEFAIKTCCIFFI